MVVGRCCQTTKNRDFASFVSETRNIAISSLVPGSYEESHFLDLWLPGMMNAYSVIAKGIGELHGERTKSAVFCLCSEVMVLQQSVRSSYCAKQRKALER